MLLLMISYQMNRLLGCLFYNLSLIGFMIVVVGYGWTMLTEFLLCCLIVLCCQVCYAYFESSLPQFVEFQKYFPASFSFYYLVGSWI